MSDISRVLRAPDRERNRIRKEYESRKALEGKLGIDKLKDFRDLAVSVFTVFTDITGQKVNAEAMTAHIA